jgi:hypothetical protein
MLFMVIELFESLDSWIAAWDDLVNFEVVPVQTSAGFWATVQPRLNA